MTRLNKLVCDNLKTIVYFFLYKASEKPGQIKLPLGKILKWEKDCMMI